MQADKNSSYGIPGGKTFGRELGAHPRNGKPSWGKREDKKPGRNSEYFKLGEIDGINGSCRCFVCRAVYYSDELREIPDAETGKEWRSTPPMILHNSYATTPSQETAKRVEKLFESAGLTITLVCPYQELPAEFFQLQISSCKKHLPNLKKLIALTDNGQITKEVIQSIKDL